MIESIRVATSPGEAQAAVVRGNRILDYTLWRPGAPDGVGDVYCGRLIAQVPAMAGGFVALLGAEGFLPDSEGAKGLAVGAMVTVRVTRAAQGNKGPRVTMRGEKLAGSGPEALLRRGPDPLSELAERYPEAPVLVDDAGLAASLRLGKRVVVTPRVFEEDIAEAIDALSRPVVQLQGGATLSIWPTPALVAIDVDAGRALAGLEGARSRHEAVNRSVLPELAQQIRLRNLSGGIVVDLAGLSQRRRVGLAPDFAAAMAGDPLHPRFLGFTALGLAEIVRARVHPPLHELLTGPLACGLAALRAVLSELGRDPSGVALRAHPSVVTALQGDKAALPDLVRRTGRRPTLRSDPSLAAGTWVLEKDHGQASTDLPDLRTAFFG